MQPLHENAGHLTDLAGEGEADLAKQAVFSPACPLTLVEARRPDHILVECHDRLPALPQHS
jgi:hypothetical protein